MKLFIILGYLGSGKTTFLYSFLEQFNIQKTAVIVNDFGDDDVDGKILAKFSPKTVYGGSMFCSCKSDKFVETAIEISKLPYDNLIVEASGFSNPFSLNELLNLINKGSATQIERCGVVTIIDATSFEKILTTLKMTKMQVAFADLILINKCDLVTIEDIARVEKLIRQINPNARIERVTNAKPSSYEIAQVEKQLPQNVFDLTLQKVSLVFKQNVTKEILDEICQKLAVFAHRIKGSVQIERDSFIYQFANGKGTLTALNELASNVIVMLSAEGNLRKLVTAVILEYPFIDIK